MKNNVQALIDNYSGWWHSIDCGDGIITKGIKGLDLLRNEVASMQLPSLVDKSVLDIGAWDGFFSFHAEEMGATRVVALDYNAWCQDNEKLLNIVSNNVSVKNIERMPNMWSSTNLPGKRGFDIIHEIKRSNIEQYVGDLMGVDLLDIGQFDIVFFLGVLYHLKDPLGALARLFALTRDLAVIETHAIYIPNFEDIALLEFYENDRLNNDSTNQFGVNAAALGALCRQVGFKTVKITSAYPPLPVKDSPDSKRSMYRLTMHAIK